MSDASIFGANLKRLRDLKGWSQERLAAEAGVGSKGYISNLEKGKRPMPPGASLELLATALATTVQELVGAPMGAPTALYAPIIGRVGADSSGEIIHIDADLGYDMALMPPGASPQAVALEVVGDSMPRMAPSGSLIFFEAQHTPPTPDMMNYWVVAELEDGRVLFKRLLRGSAPGLYALESEVGAPIEDVRLRWAAEPIALIPTKQAQRIIRRAGERQVA